MASSSSHSSSSHSSSSHSSSSSNSSSHSSSSHSSSSRSSSHSSSSHSSSSHSSSSSNSSSHSSSSHSSSSRSSSHSSSSHSSSSHSSSSSSSQGNELYRNPIYIQNFSADVTLARAGQPMIIKKIRFLSAADGDIFKLEDAAGNVLVHMVNTGNGDIVEIDLDHKFMDGVVIDVSDCTGVDATDGTDAVWIYLV